jgi:hypothetical protein
MYSIEEIRLICPIKKLVYQNTDDKLAIIFIFHIFQSANNQGLEKK